MRIRGKRKNLGKETWSTMGTQKKLNYALQDQTREAFVKAITTGLSTPPPYFPLNAQINKQGYDPLDEVLKRSMIALNADAFENEMKKQGVIVIDTRRENEFEQGYVPSSIFIGLNGRFAEWIGTLLKMDDKILLVATPGKQEESILRMARVGYENVIGFLDGGFDAWKSSGKNFDLVISIDADEMLLDYQHDEIAVIDVRKETEFEKGHVAGAINVVLQEFDSQLHKIGDHLMNEDLYVHCEGGYRSMIAASLLKRKNIHNLKNISGGWNLISKTAMPVEVPKYSMS